jgi:hypothetical protein
MTATIDIYLDTVKKTRGSQEWRPVNRATTIYLGETYTNIGDGTIIMNLLRELVEAGCDKATVVKVWRGTTPIFVPFTISSWVDKKGTQPEWLKK